MVPAAIAHAQAVMLLPTTELSIGASRAYVEVAATPAARTQGLMFRPALLTDHGMLFVFEAAGPHCFWMKNTPLPLSIAFIDEAGCIVNIADMQPLSEATHCPEAPVRYALEMEQGWFRHHDIHAGQTVSGLPRQTP